MAITSELESLLYAAGNAVASACERFPIEDRVEIEFGLQGGRFVFQVQIAHARALWMCTVTYHPSLELGLAPPGPGFVVHWRLITASSSVSLTLGDDPSKCLDQITYTVSVAIRALLEAEERPGTLH